MTNKDALASIVAMTDWERRSALCFIAGFNPFVLGKALNEMDRQRAIFERGLPVDPAIALAFQNR